MRRLTERPELVPMALPAPEEAGAGPEEAVGAARQALEALARLWGRAKEEGERRRVEGWMRAAAGRLAEWPPAAWRALDAALPAPDRTLALRPFLADLYRARLARTPREEPEERARLAHMLGFALSEMGRREEALQAAQEAVDLYRRLAAQHPDAFLPDLARSLNNLGNRLSEMGRRAEALQATQEAVDLYRRLAAQRPDAFLPIPGRQPQQPGRPAFRNGPAGGGPASHAGGGGDPPPPGRPAPRRLPPIPGGQPQQPGPSGFPPWAGGRRPCKPRRRRWTSTAAWPPNTPTPSSPTWR
jgi:tetratricopeptide (TPR) repeat protein